MHGWLELTKVNGNCKTFTVLVGSHHRGLQTEGVIHGCVAVHSSMSHVPNFFFFINGSSKSPPVSHAASAYALDCWGSSAQCQPQGTPIYTYQLEIISPEYLSYQDFTTNHPVQGTKDY